MVASTRKHRAFLSIALSGVSEPAARRLRDHATAVQDACASLGIELFNPAELVLSVGERAWERVRRSIERSSVVIVHCGVESIGVGFEAAMASRQGTPLVLLMERDGKVPSNLLRSTEEPRYEVHFGSARDLAGELRAALGLALEIEELEKSALQVEASQHVGSALRFVENGLIEALARDPRMLYDLSSRRFEELVAELLSRRGWTVSLTAATRDGGYDLFAVTRDLATGTNAMWVVECKKFGPNRRVGIEIVRSLYGVEPVLRRGANVMLATTSYFTRGVTELKASRYDLELKDHSDLVDWVKGHGGAGTHLAG